MGVGRPLGRSSGKRGGGEGLVLALWGQAASGCEPTAVRAVRFTAYHNRHTIEPTTTAPALLLGGPARRSIESMAYACIGRVMPVVLRVVAGPLIRSLPKERANRVEDVDRKGGHMGRRLLADVAMTTTLARPPLASCAAHRCRRARGRSPTHQGRWRSRRHADSLPIVACTPPEAVC